MSTRVNLVLEDEVKQGLDQLVPAGSRSRFANEAIRRELELLRRQRAAERLEALRLSGPTVPTPQLVRLVREARDRSVR